MQFNHPEVLYALFLLVIPFIVHLFQLRKFRKENFTNVKFLRKITSQTRKSSQLKKWLVLASRVLLLTCIIFAFSQPFFPSSKQEEKLVETVIYLDNSYSMQARGQRGRLLNRSIQELLEELPEEGNFTLITNDEEITNVTKNDLQEIDYSPVQLDYKTILLRAQSKFSSNPATSKKLLIISDIQDKMQLPQDPDSTGLSTYFLQLRPESISNISLDTVYQNEITIGSSSITVKVSYSGSDPGSVPVSFYNGEQLLGKSAIHFDGKNLQEMEFVLGEDVINEGRIEIEDNGLQFDNRLYFTINKKHPINISSINGADAQFLEKIFTAPQFQFASMPVNEIEFNTLNESEVIIINEIEQLPASLLNTLQNKIQDNPIFIIIPPVEIFNDLEIFLTEIGFSGYGLKREQEKLITEISFQHPLFSEVFEEQVQNFEYPKVQMFHELNSYNSSILNFDDNRPFLAQVNDNFFFSAPLNSSNSNFKQSPLVVPTFYNMGSSALKPLQLYYLLGKENRIEIPVTLPADRILQINSSNTHFIPQQQNYSNKVEIISEELPITPGNYTVINAEEPVMGLSYNIDRNENNMNFTNLSNFENVIVVNDLKEFFYSAGFGNEKSTLWKWFVIFAIIFLIIETLLLKLIK